MNQSVPSRLQRIASHVEDSEFDNPDFITVIKVIWHVLKSFRTERAGWIIGSAFILLMLWGTHGKVELLNVVWPAWPPVTVDPGLGPSLIPGIRWGNELTSWLIGILLLVIIPLLLIKFVFKQPLSKYGLGLPPKGRRKLAVVTFVFLVVVSLPAFFIGAGNHEMQLTYPLFRPFMNVGEFIVYEVSYLLFFIVIEFTFRGYLLFGLAGIRDPNVKPDRRDAQFYLDRYGLLIQMLSYTAWHLGKPLPELWGTVIWGLAAGATAYTIRSVWPIILAHWLLNVFMDATIVISLGLILH